MFEFDYSYHDTDRAQFNDPDYRTQDELFQELLEDAAIAEFMAQEEAKYIESLLNRPFNPDDDF